MSVLSMRLDDDLDARLSQEARRENMTRSELVREALTAFLRERERQRFIDELSRAARGLIPGEARALAEEALATDNEALLAAEPSASYAPRQRAKTAAQGRAQPGTRTPATGRPKPRAKSPRR